VSHLRLCGDGAPQTAHDIWENCAAGASHAGDSSSLGLSADKGLLGSPYSQHGTLWRAWRGPQYLETFRAGAAPARNVSRYWGPPPLVLNGFILRSPGRVPHRTPPACAKRATYPEPPPVIPVPESIAALAAFQLSIVVYLPTEYMV
jgi:hypothetical protein